MKRLIVDTAKDNIFLMIIVDKAIYNVTHENSKTNYDKLILLITDFLKKHDLEFRDIDSIYINRGPGSFAGIRNSLSIIKAIHLIKKIDYYCFSFEDFRGVKGVKYHNIPYLCDKFEVKKNLIKPIYIS